VKNDRQTYLKPRSSSGGMPLARGDTGSLTELSFRDVFTRNPEMAGCSTGYPLIPIKNIGTPCLRLGRQKTRTCGYDKCCRDCFDKKRLAMTDCRGLPAVCLAGSTPSVCGKRGRETISFAGSELPMWDVGRSMKYEERKIVKNDRQTYLKNGIRRQESGVKKTYCLTLRTED